MSTPKATHRGTIFEGLLDCYVLDDERRVVSQRGIVRTLSGRDTGALAPYLNRLPKRFAYLASGADEVTFRTPEGATAKGREATWLVDLLRAYSEAADAGELHSSQMHLALNARKVLHALAGIGIVALIDESTGYQQVRHAEALGFAFRALLAEKAGDWSLTWNNEIVDALCRLHGERYDGGPHPRWLASTYEKIYRLVLTDEVYDELKRRTPEPHHGNNHHQWLTPEAKVVLDKQLPIITALAETCSTKEEFWARLEFKYRRQPLQLSWLVPGKRGAA
jgi:hypothetical protein